jgi:membrane-bound lytic murein transglycosylase D
MRRQSLILLLAGAVGCAGKASVQPTQPSPQVSTATPEAPEAPVPPAPRPLPIDSNQVSEIARDVNLSADSAADEAVLDQLAVAQPDVPSSDDEEVPAVPVSWDIDVTTWGDHERVQFYLSFFEEQAHPRFQIWIGRMPVYEPMIRQKLQAANMPTDLVYLALIESGFSNSAISRTRAVGMWQFMPRTGKEYGLRIDSWVDERRDPVKSTNAALEFLSDLYQRFGSYYLAAAAYNAGGGKISRGLKRVGAKPTVSQASSTVPVDGEEALTEDEDEGFSDADFFKLYDTKHIRRETKDYVPKLIAAARIAKEPQRYGFEAAPPTAPYPLDSLVVSGMTGLDVVAELSDTSLSCIRELNPQYLRLATPPGTTSIVRVPAGRQASTQAAYASLPAAERVTFAYYTAKKGDTPARVARHYGVAVGVLYETNPWMRSGSAIKSGRQVVVPTGGSASVVVARQVSTAREPAGSGARGGYHTVRKGETLGGIARRYHMSTAQLKSRNGLSSNTIRVGQKLRVSGGSSRSTTQVASRDRAKGGGTASAGSSYVKYKVRRGDTLSGIARRHGVTVASIRQVNNLSGGLKSGTTIRIPKKA